MGFPKQEYWSELPFPLPGDLGLHAHGEGELVITLESWETARSSRGVAKAQVQTASQLNSTKNLEKS